MNAEINILDSNLAVYSIILVGLWFGDLAIFKLLCIPFLQLFMCRRHIRSSFSLDFCRVLMNRYRNLFLHHIQKGRKRFES